LRNQK